MKKYNKPFEPSDMEEVSRSLAAKELRDLAEELYQNGILTSSVGHLPDKLQKHSFSPEYLWAYSRIIEICGLRPGMKVLDGGGASTPIVFYCGKKGINITTIEQQGTLVENTKRAAEKMGWGSINAVQGDMTETGFPDNYFDVVFSVAVLQFLPSEIKMKAVKEFSRVLKPGGILGLIFDFGKSAGRKGEYEDEYYDSFHLPLRNTREIQEYIIEPVGLPLYGNQDLSDELSRDKSLVRKNLIRSTIKNKNIKKAIAFPYLYFKSPYFNYTFYSLFFKKL